MAFERFELTLRRCSATKMFCQVVHFPVIVFKLVEVQMVRHNKAGCRNSLSHAAGSKSQCTLNCGRGMEPVSTSDDKLVRNIVIRSPIGGS